MALLDGKTILLTGAARGIGLAAALGMRRQGAHVIVSDIDGSALDAAGRLFSGEDGGCTLVPLDVGDAASIRSVIAQISRSHGVLHGLVNNAAMLDGSATATVDIGRFRQVLDINLTSALALTQAALPLLRAGRQASVINTLSTQAVFGQPGSVAYATAKGGLLNLTRCMAVDLGADGIRVNAVAPGFIDTRMARRPDGSHEHHDPAFREFYLASGRIPLRRPGTPQDCAGAFLFLASELSAYVTGQTIFVDGGLSATY